MAAPKTCKANVGTRRDPRPCGQPVAEGMLWGCEQHKTTLIPTGTAGVYTRGGKYVALTVHRKKQVKTFHDKFDQARAAQRSRTGSVVEKPAGDRTPFDTYAMNWIDTYGGRTTRGLDDDTRKAYKRALELYAIPHFGATPIREIRPRAYKQLIANLKRDHSIATVRKYCAPIKVLFADAVADEDIDRNPTLGIPIGGDKNDAPDRIEALTQAQVDRVLGAISDDRDRLLFRLVAHTGCRISEALGLDWTDVDFEHNQLHIRQQFYRGRLKKLKTSNGERTIYLDPTITEELKSARGIGPMFASLTGQRLVDRNLRRVLDRAADRAGVERFGPHRFRHTHVSQLLQRGWPSIKVAARIGDKVQTVEANYAHFIPEDAPDLSFTVPGQSSGQSDHPETTETVVALPSAESRK